MTTATPFLGEARGRLLPASIPMRFFAAAVVFHLLAWLTLLAGGAQSFGGGLGTPLAALHLITLGVLAMTAMGASLQLLPVATRQGVASAPLLAALWWVYVPAVGWLTAAMAWARPGALVTAALLVAAALVVFALLLGRMLWRARGMTLLVVHGWAAWLSLLAVLVSGVSLAATYIGKGLLDHSLALSLHVNLAAYGFMGLLVLGFSFILLPMFAIAEPPAMRPSLASAALVIGALAVSAFAAADVLPAAARGLAQFGALLGLALHVGLMSLALRRGMRRSLGHPMVLVRIGWAALLASLVVALALEAGAGFERQRTLFVVLLVGGLLTFMLGVLARIVPFLASMHAPPGKRGPPLPSALTSQRALAVHCHAHLAAFALLLLAVGLDSVWLTRAAAMAGCVSGMAMGWFFLYAWRGMRIKAHAPGAGS